jgi:hypothetical protein
MHKNSEIFFQEENTPLVYCLSTISKCFLSLVYNQVIILIILIGAQKGIKYSMISHGNKGMKKGTMYEFARLNKYHLDILIVLNKDSYHQLNK